MIDIPELQLITVCFLGFVLGAVLLEYFMQRPILFALVAGSSFFVMRYLAAITEQDPPTGVIGNGIVVAGFLWIIFISMMVLGRIVSHRRWGRLGD